MKIKIFFFILLISFTKIKGQKKNLNVDSILKKIPTLTDSVKCKAYNSIARYLGSNYPDSAFALADSGLKYAKKSNSYYGEANANFNLGFTSFLKGKYDQCITYFSNSLKIHELLKNKQGICNLYNSMGNVYSTIKNTDLALACYKKANELARQEPVDRTMIALTDNGIGLIFYQKKEYKRSIEVFEEIIKLNEGLNDLYNDGTAAHNITLNYLGLKDYKRASEYNDKAITMFKESKYNYGLAQAYYSRSDINSDQKKYSEAIEDLKFAYKISLERNAWRELSDYSKRLSELYTITKDHYNANIYLNEHIKYYDSLSNDGRKKLLAEADAKYQNHEKEQELILKRAELKNSQLQVSQRNNLIYIFATATIIFVILLFLVYKQFYEKKKANISLTFKNEQIEKQKQIIEVKNKDITDSINYSKYIQQAIIPSVQQVKDILPNSFVIFSPKDIVSGDFYFLETVKGNTYLAVIDCTGHGVPGAMLSVFAHSCIKNIISQNNFEKDPAGILSQICHYFKNNLLSHNKTVSLNDGVDMGICIINKDRDRIYFAGAKNDLIKINSNNIEELAGNRWGISGANSIEQSKFTNHEIIIVPKDKFYLHTDGFIDQFGGPKGKKFKQKKLNEKLVNYSNLEFNLQGDKLAMDFNLWKGDLEQIDDVTLIGFEI